MIHKQVTAARIIQLLTSENSQLHLCSNSHKIKIQIDASQLNRQFTHFMIFNRFNVLTYI